MRDKSRMGSLSNPARIYGRIAIGQHPLVVHAIQRHDEIKVIHNPSMVFVKGLSRDLEVRLVTSDRIVVYTRVTAVATPQEPRVSQREFFQCELLVVP